MGGLLLRHDRLAKRLELSRGRLTLPADLRHQRLLQLPPLLGLLSINHFQALLEFRLEPAGRVLGHWVVPLSYDEVRVQRQLLCGRLVFHPGDVPLKGFRLLLQGCGLLFVLGV